jgi:sec-independent protein translocase protein TatC
MATAATDDEDDGPPGDKKMPLIEHLIELRQRLIWAIAAYALCFIVIFIFFHKPIFGILVKPMNALPNPEGRRMIFTAPTEAFFTYMKVSAWSALCISFPAIANQIWKFVAPGLYQNEKNAFLPFLIATPFMFALGAAFLYFVVLPYGLQFFASFEISREEAGGVPIQFEAKMNEYLSFVMVLILAFGVAFELPVLLTLLIKVGIMTVEQLETSRRYAVVAITAFAALVTPPDAFSMMALAVPMYGLYEVSIIIGRLFEKKRAAADAAYEAEEEAERAARRAKAGAAPTPAAAPRPPFFEENDFNLAR